MKILHTMLRVGDLERSIEFYTKVLEMQLLRRKDYPDGSYTLAFLGYGPEEEGAVLELTYNWGTASYEIGTGYGHIAIAVEDLQKAVDKIRGAGGTVAMEPTQHASGTWIAFVKDPDNYPIELIQRSQA